MLGWLGGVGCAGVAPVQVDPPEVRVGGIPTVAEVSWTTDPATPSALEWGTDGASTHRGPLSTGPAHTTTVWGVPETTEVWVRVVDGDGEPLSDTVRWTTGVLPAEVPRLTATGEPDPTGDRLVTSVGGLGYAVIVLDAEGRLLWAHPDGRSYLVSRARLARDGGSILYNAFWMDLYAGLGEIVRVSLDGGTVTTVPVPLQSHDFVELPDGTLATYVLEARTVDGVQYVADTLVEIAPDGTWTTVWNAWEDPTTPFTAPPAGDLTWTHANALDWDEAAEAYRVGLRNLDCVLTLTRTGEVLDHFGGTSSDWRFAGTPFDGQHQFEWAGDRVRVFDNGPEAAADSRVVEYTLDAETHTATEIWSYHSDPPTYVYAGGDVHRDRLDATWVTWTTAGQLQRVGADGEVLGQLEAPLGYGVAFTTWVAPDDTVDP